MSRFVSKDAIFDFCTSDFATVVTTTAFVDKTMMIKDVFDATDAAFHLITASPRSGKSTNLDMVRRYVEIQVDDYGNRRPLTHTDNYNLFTKNNLEISELTVFFKRNFGNYPVVYMDWKPLGEASDYGSMIGILKTITTGLFELHRYFPKIRNVWTDDLKIEEFEKYCRSSYAESEIGSGFKLLCKLLFRHFEKKVFVFIDNCDAFVDSDIFRNHSGDRNKMVSLIESVVDALLNNNQCVGRALLTGVLPLTGDGFPFGRYQIRCYSFIDQKPFYRYYALTQNELHSILDKLSPSGTEVNDLKREITTLLHFRTACEHNVGIFNIFSVLRYFHTGEFRPVNKYCIRNFSILYMYPDIRKKLVELLMGDEIQVDITEPLSAKYIIQLNNLIENGEDWFPESLPEEMVIIMLYHFGHLSVKKIDYSMTATFVMLTIGSVSSLAQDILLTNRELYRRTWNDAEKVCSSILHSITPTDFDAESFEEILRKWYSNLGYSFLTIENKLLTRLFMILVATIVPFKERVVFCSPNDDVIALVVKTSYWNHSLCLTTEEDTAEPSTDNTLRIAAEKACNEVVTYINRDQQALFDDSTGEEMFIVGIGYSWKTKSCRVKTVNIPATENEEEPSPIVAYTAVPRSIPFVPGFNPTQ